MFYSCDQIICGGAYQGFVEMQEGTGLSPACVDFLMSAIGVKLQIPRGQSGTF